MESHRFDTMVKTLGSGRSRRRVLGGLASGAAAAGIFARNPIPAAAGTCKAQGKACKETSQCCDGLDCLSSGNGPTNPHSNSGSTAGSGKACTYSVCVDHDFTAGGVFLPCGAGSPFGACFCDLTTEGTSGCWQDSNCGDFGFCNDSGDCKGRLQCVDASDCGRNCLLPC